MSKSIKEKLVEKTAEYSGTAVGAWIGAGIGTAVAGPIGAVGGSIAGTMVENVFVWAGEEIKERYFSKSEGKRVKTVYDLAEEKISKKLYDGKVLRSESFYRDSVDDRSSAKEILEGVLIASQRENEEKKLLYLANLYANINFDETVSRPMANQLVKIAATVSFRQLVVLSVIGNNQFGTLGVSLYNTAFRGYIRNNDKSIAAEIFDLYRTSLIVSSDPIYDASSFTPSHLVMNGMGELLYNLMELNTMPKDEIVDTVVTFLSGDFPMPPKEEVVTGELPIYDGQVVEF